MQQSNENRCVDAGCFQCTSTEKDLRKLGTTLLWWFSMNVKSFIFLEKSQHELTAWLTNQCCTRL